MTDKRNIVIKVSYPVAGKSADNAVPRIVTEWNVKRILFAVCALVLMFASLLYVVNNGSQKNDSDTAVTSVNAGEQLKDVEIKNLEIPRQIETETNSAVKPKIESNKNSSKQIADIPIKGIIKKQSNEKVIKEKGYSKINSNVPRALLTYSIKNKEPVGEAVRSVDADSKKPVWLYYFTELKAMKGNKVYHEWLKNGVVVSRREMTIPSDTWRTSSRKLLSDAEKGKWTVRLVDKNGLLLNEKNFKVE